MGVIHSGDFVCNGKRCTVFTIYSEVYAIQKQKSATCKNRSHSFINYSSIIFVIPIDAPPRAFIMLTSRSISFCGSLISRTIEFVSWG